MTSQSLSKVRVKEGRSACHRVAYIHTHRVTEILIDKGLPHFSHVVVVVVHQALKKPPPFENRGTTGVCWDTIAEFLEVFLLSLW